MAGWPMPDAGCRMPMQARRQRTRKRSRGCAQAQSLWGEKMVLMSGRPSAGCNHPHRVVVKTGVTDHVDRMVRFDNLAMTRPATPALPADRPARLPWLSIEYFG